jgi:ATP-binding cassette subfamily B protein
MEKHPPLPKEIMPFIWHFIRPHIGKVIVVMLCPLVWAIVTSANPYVLKLVIDSVVNFPGDPKDVWTVAAKPVALFIFLQVVLDMAMRLEEWAQLLLIPPIKAKMRAEMFDYAQQHSHRYFQDNLAGSLSNKVLDMVRAFENMFISVSSTFLPITLSTILSVFLLWTVNVWFALFVLAWFVIYLIITAYCSLKCVIVSDQHSESNSELSGKIVDAFRNMAAVRLFGRRKYENSYLNKYQEVEVRRAQILGRELIKVHFFQGIASTLLFCLTLVLFIFFWQRGGVTVGDFTFVMSTTFSLLILTWWMASQFVIFFKEVGVARQALSIINVPHEIIDASDAKPLIVNSGKIEFDNVTFNYVPNRNIFQEKSIVIEPGEKVGLVGFSGSGKTTFLYLILRFFDVHKGKILIDGQDIKKVTQQSLRDQVAIIPQDTMLFHRTLMENIRYGKENATNEEVIEASKKAACHDFINELEHGYNSIVGEGGVKLSGGQRQRIAIARAILKKAPILVLDEATSALDTATERQIQMSLWKLMQNSTTIVIAHRLSTLSMLDRILVFDDGVIIESGTHAELLDAQGHYAYLWKLQSDGFLPDKQKRPDEKDSNGLQAI